MVSCRPHSLPGQATVLVHPHVNPSRLLKSLKGLPRERQNKLLERTGDPFWQKESYDHWVRGRAEFERIRVDIENNPVTAGLVKAPEQYPWSSASVEKVSTRHARVRAPRLTFALLSQGSAPQANAECVHSAYQSRRRTSMPLPFRSSANFFVSWPL